MDRLNMPHDDDHRCQRFHASGELKHIMSKMMQNDTKPWMWSSCSRHHLTEFLESSRSICLLDSPKSDIMSNMSSTAAAQLLPGEQFDEDRQCELVYGMYLCSICMRMWYVCYTVMTQVMDPRYVRSCRHVEHCGVPPSTARRKAVRLSFYRGQMVPGAARITGVTVGSVWRRTDTGCARLPAAGASGTRGANVRAHAAVAFSGDNDSVMIHCRRTVVRTALAPVYNTARATLSRASHV